MHYQESLQYKHPYIKNADVISRQIYLYEDNMHVLHQTGVHHRHGVLPTALNT